MGCIHEKMETRGKAREVLVARSMFDPAVFKMKDGELMLTKADNKSLIGEAWQICLPESIVMEEVMLEVSPEWNADPDLIMGDEAGMMITETYTKRKRDKGA